MSNELGEFVRNVRRLGFSKECSDLADDSSSTLRRDKGEQSITLSKFEWDAIMEIVDPAIATGVDVSVLKLEIARIKRIARPMWRHASVCRVRWRSVAAMRGQSEFANGGFISIRRAVCMAGPVAAVAAQVEELHLSYCELPGGSR